MSVDTPVTPVRSSARAGTVTGRHVLLVVASRFTLVALCGLLHVLTEEGPEHRTQLISLVVIAAVFSTANVVTARWTAPLAVLEGISAAVVIAAVAPLQSALLPYLLAPALAAGLGGGLVYAVVVGGLPAVLVVGSRLFISADEPLDEFLASVALWFALALATALLGAWVRRIELSAVDGSRTYAEINHLLLELRDAARHLPGSLDEVTIAQSLLQDMRETTVFTRGGVAAVTDGQRLVPLARFGASAADISVELTPDTVWGRAWATRRPAVASQTLGGAPHAFCAVIPVTTGETLVALVGIERTEESFGSDETKRCAAVAAAAAPGLDTASLFAEVRTIATAEERRRLAREIHDGIAQELASLGYFVDDLMSRPADEPAQASDLKDLRRELTRVVTELRLSIFDLRSEVRQDTGVGEALGAYVRSVGAGSDLTVHLVLDEPRGRLRVEVEAELLRIAQEAITNARKHADAENLWVTCRIDPPHAVLRIEDDGSGLGPRRGDSYGLDIMNERASRIGGAVHVGERPGGGTLVEVLVGRPRRGNRRQTDQPSYDEQEGALRVQDGATR